jgi:glycosyltransferase involved in cell wall biosynthesis
MSKYIHPSSYIHTLWKTSPKVIGAFPSLLGAGSTVVQKQETDAQTQILPVPEKIKRAQRLHREQATSQEARAEMTQRVLPTPTYASIEINHDGITIAEITPGSESKTEAEIVTTTKSLYLRNATAALLKWLQNSTRQQDRQYIAAALRQQDGHQLETASRLWLQQDIVPYIIDVDAADQRALEERIRRVVDHFDEDNIVKVGIRADHEVEIAELVTLEDYRKVTPAEDFALLQRLALAFCGKKLVFFSATPQGGGVALMRHALIRLLRLLNVDAHWYVLIPKREAFNITKSKFHNVLQAVALPETVLTDEDRDIYNAWIAENAEAFAEVFKQADVIVIDDPQPCGLIPYIKEANADAKIIYRSHIQIVGSLASQPGTTQHTTWQFLWQYIRQADIFVSHPMQMFIPEDVPAEMIFYMPATTDPLDGLNKPLTEQQMSIYMTMFNNLLIADGQTPLDAQRPYIVQIARFDPSKGIPDVLDAFKQLRDMLEANGKVAPQLVIAGNGSIDDPDGVPVYNLVKRLLEMEPYASFASDVKVMRLPHRDQVLNTLLRKSAVVLQLSIKEGFEIKVTEALMKGKPVIAYQVGGIPLQIEHGVTGFLVEAGHTTQVARHLYDLLTDKRAYRRMSEAAVQRAKKDYLTVPNAICWLYLANQLANSELPQGNYQWVKALAEQQYAPKLRKAA